MPAMMQSVYLDPVLSYLDGNKDTATTLQIREICTQFYNMEELKCAKDLLWQIGGEDLLGHYTRRRESAAVNAKVKTMEDIQNALETLHKSGATPAFAVGAETLNRLPRVAARESLPVSICERLNMNEERIEQLESLFSRVAAIEAKVQRPAPVPGINYAAVAAARPPAEQGFWSTSPIRKSTPTVTPSEPRTMATEAVPMGKKSEVDSHGFVRVQKNRQKRKKGTMGSRTDCQLKAAPEPMRDVFVGRLGKDVTAAEVTDHAKDGGVILHDLEQISSTSSPYTSFRLRIRLSDLKKVIDGSFWPFGALVRRFYARRNAGSDETEPKTVADVETSETEDEELPRASPSNGITAASPDGNAPAEHSRSN